MGKMDMVTLLILHLLCLDVANLYTIVIVIPYQPNLKTKLTAKKKK
jgi:hypothetical protein